MKKIYIILVTVLMLSISANVALLIKNNTAKTLSPINKKINTSPQTKSEKLLEPKINKLGAIWWAGDKEKKEIAITFDDGPDPRYTEQILNILDKYQVKATFFEVGSIAERYPNITREIVQKGHALGNHTFSHPTNRIPDQKKEIELNKTNDILTKITSERVILFRSPYGYFDTTFFTVSQRLGMYQIMWSVVPEDYNKPGSNVIADRIIKQTENGSIILLHDGGGDRSQTVQALPVVIEELQNKGFKLVTVPELLSLK